MRYLVSGMLIIVGLIHLLPLPGILGNEQLARLYGISIDGPNIAILMRHRAALFGLVGLLMLLAAFKPALQVAAFVAGFVSIVSFLWLATSVGGYNAEIGRVFVADLVALGCLIVGIAAYFHAQRVG